MAAATFHLQVVSLRAMLFDAEVKSVYLFGDEGEYELLPYHFPLMGVLIPGVIKIHTITHVEDLPIKAGILIFAENRCTIIIEEVGDTLSKGAAWSTVEILKKTGTVKKDAAAKPK